jgi:hypothetical protein
LSTGVDVGTQNREKVDASFDEVFEGQEEQKESLEDWGRRSLGVSGSDGAIWLDPGEV